MKHPLFYFFLGALLAGALSVYFTAKSIECPECPEQIIDSVDVYSYEDICNYTLRYFQSASNTERFEKESVISLNEEWVGIGDDVYIGHWEGQIFKEDNSSTEIVVNGLNGNVYVKNLTYTWLYSR